MRPDFRPNASLLSAAATASLLLAQAPVLAESSADDIGVINVSLKDIKPRFGFKGRRKVLARRIKPVLAGSYRSRSTTTAFGSSMHWQTSTSRTSTPPTAALGTVLDAFTIGTLNYLGYRWLNGIDRSWMFGINAGYDSRPVKSGGDERIQGLRPANAVLSAASGFSEAIHKKWDFNAYALIPIGEYGLGGDNVANLNSGWRITLTTFGLKLAYAISDQWKLGAGYYYELDEKSDLITQNHRWLRRASSLDFKINNQLEAGVLYSYDDYFKSRVVAI